MAGGVSRDVESVSWVSSPVGGTRCLYLGDVRWMQPLPVVLNFHAVPENQ